MTLYAHSPAARETIRLIRKVKDYRDLQVIEEELKKHMESFKEKPKEPVKEKPFEDSAKVLEEALRREREFKKACLDWHKNAIKPPVEPTEDPDDPPVLPTAFEIKAKEDREADKWACKVMHDLSKKALGNSSKQITVRYEDFPPKEIRLLANKKLQQWAKSQGYTHESRFNDNLGLGSGRCNVKHTITLKDTEEPKKKRPKERIELLKVPDIHLLWIIPTIVSGIIVWVHLIILG